MTARHEPGATPPSRSYEVSGPAGAIPVVEQGAGRPIVIVHGGTGDLTAWAGVADRLATSFRVLRYTRPTYRLSPPARGAAAAQLEVAEAHAVAASVGEPVILVGHSSGAVVALEAVVADPALFAALALYEPPLDVTHSPEGTRALEHARAAMDRGDGIRAMRVHLTELVGMPRLAVRAFLALPPARRLFATYAEGQVADNEMLDALPAGMARFAQIQQPVLLITGGKSPAHLRRRSDDLARALPHAPQRQVLPRQGHGANLRDPDAVAAAISDFVGDAPD